MRNATWMLVGLCLAGFALAQEDKASTTRRSPEALEILNKAVAAIREVDAVRYDVQSTPQGVATEFVSPAEGSAVLLGWAGGIPEKLHVHVNTTRLGTQEPLALTGGGDGETFFIVDHAAKTAYQGRSITVEGSDGGSTLMAAAMFEFVRDTPFEEELGGSRVELQGTETVGDEVCHKIYVVYPGGRAASTWWFSKRDLLPRRHTRHFELPRGAGSLDTRISKLETNPKVSAKLFKLQLPKGYERIAP